MTEYTGLFSNRYQLQGSDWVRRLDPEDQRVFIHIGLAAGEYGRKGGTKRAQTAQRDERGRFICNSSK